MLSTAKPVWLVIPAAGIGTRMQADRPKQYLEVCGKTLLQHTLDRTLTHPKVAGAVVALNKADHYWPSLTLNYDKPLLTCTGGGQRNDSVLLALKHLQNKGIKDALVLVHDAVRCCVLQEDISSLIDEALNNPDGAILGIPVTDTIKRGNDRCMIEATIPRENLWRACTPQAFSATLLFEALTLAADKKRPITDDASAVELSGGKPSLVSCAESNIKVTHPHDLEQVKRFFACE